MNSIFEIQFLWNLCNRKLKNVRVRWIWLNYEDNLVLTYFIVDYLTFRYFWPYIKRHTACISIETINRKIRIILNLCWIRSYFKFLFEHNFFILHKKITILMFVIIFWYIKTMNHSLFCTITDFFTLYWSTISCLVVFPGNLLT